MLHLLYSENCRDCLIYIYLILYMNLSSPQPTVDLFKKELLMSKVPLAVHLRSRKLFHVISATVVLVICLISLGKFRWSVRLNVRLRRTSNVV